MSDSLGNRSSSSSDNVQRRPSTISANDRKAVTSNLSYDEMQARNNNLPVNSRNNLDTRFSYASFNEPPPRISIVMQDDDKRSSAEPPTYQSNENMARFSYSSFNQPNRNSGLVDSKGEAKYPDIALEKSPRTSMLRTSFRSSTKRNTILNNNNLKNDAFEMEEFRPELEIDNKVTIDTPGTERKIKSTSTLTSSVNQAFEPDTNEPKKTDPVVRRSKINEPDDRMMSMRDSADWE